MYCDSTLFPFAIDDRQEWVEKEYYCEECDKEFTRRTEYDQNGLVSSDELETD
jgi:hypothetical protein